MLRFTEKKERPSRGSRCQTALRVLRILDAIAIAFISCYTLVLLYGSMCFGSRILSVDTERWEQLYICHEARKCSHRLHDFNQQSLTRVQTSSTCVNAYDNSDRKSRVLGSSNMPVDYKRVPSSNRPWPAFDLQQKGHQVCGPSRNECYILTTTKRSDPRTATCCIWTVHWCCRTK